MKKVLAFAVFTTIWLGVKFAAHLSLIDFINRSFFVGIIAIMIGACFVILKSGFLSLFLDGFKMAGLYMLPKSRAMELADKMMREDEEWQTFKIRFSGRLALLAFLIGVSSITVSLIGLALN